MSKNYRLISRELQFINAALLKQLLHLVVQALKLVAQSGRHISRSLRKLRFSSHLLRRSCELFARLTHVYQAPIEKALKMLCDDDRTDKQEEHSNGLVSFLDVPRQVSFREGVF